MSIKLTIETSTGISTILLISLIILFGLSDNLIFKSIICGLIIPIGYQLYYWFNLLNINLNFMYEITELEKTYNAAIAFLIDDEIYNRIRGNIIDRNIQYIKSMEHADTIQNYIFYNRSIGKNIKLILHTHGGSIMANDAIINTILSVQNINIEVYVPRYAYSSGSLIALASNNIIMYPESYLAPCDPQMTFNISGNDKTYPSSVLLNIFSEEHKHKKFSDVVYLEGLTAKLYHSNNIATLEKIFHSKNLSKKYCSQLINFFGSGEYPHSKPINGHYLQKTGLPIDFNFPEDIEKLFNSYSYFIGQI